MFLTASELRFYNQHNELFCTRLGRGLMTLNPPLKPGEKVPVSGQYGEIGPLGGHIGKEVTGVKGKPLPPSPKKGMSFKLVDKTKH